MKEFEVGKIYCVKGDGTTRYPFNTAAMIRVIRRTKSFITFESLMTGNKFRKKIHVYLHDFEFIKFNGAHIEAYRENSNECFAIQIENGKYVSWAELQENDTKYAVKFMTEESAKRNAEILMTSRHWNKHKLAVVKC